MPAKSERPRIYLNKVHLKGFKSIEDLSIDLQKGLNILIGKNGSGKSNFIEFLHKALTRRRDARINYSSAEIQFISDDAHVFDLEIERTSQIGLRIDEEYFEPTLGYIEKFSIDETIFLNTGTPRKNRGKFKFEDREISYTYNYRLALNKLGYRAIFPSYIKFNLPENLDGISTPITIKIDRDEGVIDGEYPKTLDIVNTLISKIESYFGDEQNDIQEITQHEIIGLLRIDYNLIENLKAYSPISELRFSSNINIYTDENLLIVENIKLDFKINDNWLPWSQLSDGTKRLFYIISEVTNSNSLILIEEPELGIHPHQFHLLMNFLKEQSEDKQIIISTHSPKALDHLRTDELNNLLITAYDPQLGTQIRHLTDAEIDKAKIYREDVGFLSDYWLLSDLER